MGQDRQGFWGRIGGGPSTRRLSKLVDMPNAVSAKDLRGTLAQVDASRAELDEIAAKARTALLARSGGDDGIERPDQCDWAERSEPWRTELRPRGHVDVPSPTKIGGGMTLFHDAAYSDISLRQDVTPSHIGGSKFGLVFEVYRFDGSFLSLVQDLPPAALAGLTLNHYFSVQIRVEREQPSEIYARLNVQHGPNTDQIVRQVSFKGDTGTAEFDLAYSKINEKRLEKAWLDLILEGPEMNRIALWDMVILRAPRADI